MLRPLGADRYNRKYTVKTFQQVLRCGGVSAGKRVLVTCTFLEYVTMNSNLHVKVLNDHMLPFYGDDNAHFSQDDASCHKARRVNKCLYGHQIRTIEWPGHSLDLNPIVNFRNQMKRKPGKHCLKHWYFGRKNSWALQHNEPSILKNKNKKTIRQYAQSH